MKILISLMVSFTVSMASAADFNRIGCKLDQFGNSKILIDIDQQLYQENGKTVDVDSISKKGNKVTVTFLIEETTTTGDVKSIEIQAPRGVVLGQIETASIRYDYFDESSSFSTYDCSFSN